MGGSARVEVLLAQDRRAAALVLLLSTVDGI
jgi:hypothetical protein